MNIVSSSRMKEIDRISIEEMGFGPLVLMENAGIRLLETAERLAEILPDSRIICVAGSGNNGGDALVIARQIFSLHPNHVDIIITKGTGTEAFLFNLNLCRNLGINIINYENETELSETIIEKSDIVFDGISGTGIKGSLRGAAATLTERLNLCRAVKFAIDVPSGTGEGFKKGFPAVNADYTLTVGLPKRCLFLPAARSFCGEIHTVSIGFPQKLKTASGFEADKRDWQLYSEASIPSLMPKLKPDDYKNSRGHLAVFAGSPGTTGAASLCADAADHSPAGLVSLFADGGIYNVLAAKHRAVMVKPLAAGNNGSILPELDGFDAFAVGPGWGTADRRTMLMQLLECGRGVLDADGINVLASMIAETESFPDLSGRWILTPHAGEFKRLFSGSDPLADPYDAVKTASEKLNCVMMLKGVVTFIAAPDGRAAVIDGSYPRLGTAGSGDVLCGITGGFAATGMDLFDAAVLGVLVHLRAGKRCGRRGNDDRWFSAEELISYF